MSVTVCWHARRLSLTANMQFSPQPTTHTSFGLKNSSKTSQTDYVCLQGMDNAVPKVILKMMNVDGMTRENVASHLQKYRLHLKHQANGQGTRSIGMQSADRSLVGAPHGVGSTAGGLPLQPMPGSLLNLRCKARLLCQTGSIFVCAVLELFPYEVCLTAASSWCLSYRVVAHTKRPSAFTI